MKHVLSLFSAFVLVTVAALAQYPTLHTLPGDPNATQIGQMSVSTEVTYTYFGKKQGERIGVEIMVWRTSMGGVEYTMSTPSIAPETGLAIDYIPTQEIYRQIATNAVAEGVRYGYMPPAGTQMTKVWYESNVERIGTGIATRFMACASWQPVSRDYSVSFTNGVATIVDLSTTSFPNSCDGLSGSVQ